MESQRQLSSPLSTPPLVARVVCALRGRGGTRAENVMENIWAPVLPPEHFRRHIHTVCFEGMMES